MGFGVLMNKFIAAVKSSTNMKSKIKFQHKEFEELGI